MHDFWNWVMSIKGEAAVAGAAGGIVRWATLREDWKTGATSLIVGMLCAVYLSETGAGAIEAAFKTFGLTKSIDKGAAGFIVGIGGVTISGFVLDVIKVFRERKAGGLNAKDG